VAIGQMLRWSMHRTKRVRPGEGPGSTPSYPPE
jgi:hypothetical protein